MESDRAFQKLSRDVGRRNGATRVRIVLSKSSVPLHEDEREESRRDENRNGSAHDNAHLTRSRCLRRARAHVAANRQLKVSKAEYGAVKPFRRRLLLSDVRQDRKRKPQNYSGRVRDETRLLHY